MKKPQDRTQEKEEIVISSSVLSKFRSELQKLSWNFDKFCDAYLATRTRNGVRSVLQYDDVEKYEKYLRTNYLVDPDLFYDFTYPINYFYLLLSKTQVPYVPPSPESIQRLREKLENMGLFKINV